MEKGEEQIRRAIEDGEFDNLPGKGKPLHLDENPFEDPEWHLANKVLLDGGFTLPWIEKRKDIEVRLAAARAALGQAWLRRSNALRAGQEMGWIETQWRQAEEVFRSGCSELNRLIFSYNLEVPTYQVQMLSIQVEREIQKIKSGGLADR